MNNLKIIKAEFAQKELIRRLMELYQHDMSTATGNELNQFGLYDYPWLDSYWTEDNRHPYIFQIQDKIVGFSLVNKHVIFPENEGAHSVAEFFILKKYRRQGFGQKAACEVIMNFPGKWEVGVLEKNDVGAAFWRPVIQDLAPGKFKEQISDSDIWKGLIFSFSV
jgi:predicted acetyltransferase